MGKTGVRRCGKCLRATYKKNPRAYHGSGQEVVFASKMNRTMRNWESIGTWITNDIEHAKMFGKNVYQVEYPETLKLFHVEDPDNLTEPFITPALSSNLVSRPDKVLLKTAYVEAPKQHPFYGKRPYEFVNDLFERTERRLRKENDYFAIENWRKHNQVSKTFTDRVYRTLTKAREVWYKLYRNPAYIDYLYDFYTSKGYDGLMWENTAMDAGLHGGDSDHRQTQYLIFHPEKYPFTHLH